MGDNPYHNQHIQEYAAALEETIAEVTQHYDGILLDVIAENESLKLRVEALEQAQEKPVEIEANVRLNEKSAKNFRAAVARLLRF